MTLSGMSFPDLLGTFIGFLLTLLVFSYIIGDNKIFRLVVYIFIGVAAGYVALMAIDNVLWPQLFLPVFQERETGRLVRLIPVLLALLLLTKVSTRLSFLGTPVMAFLVGVGAATAVGGAITGTVFPQIGAAINMFNLQSAAQSGENLISVFLSGSIAVVGTVSTLAYFHFGAHRKDGRSSQRYPWLEWIAWIGRAFIAITFGTIFAGIYAAALAAMIERLNFLVKFILSFFMTQS